MNVEIRIEKIVGMNLDGASVNKGKYASVAAITREDIPHLISIHCIAHNLEMAVSDARKNTYIKGLFENTIKGVVKFYSCSPKHRRELVEMSSYFETSVVQIGSVSQIRWLCSQHRALSAVKNNFI